MVHIPPFRNGPNKPADPKRETDVVTTPLRAKCGRLMQLNIEKGRLWAPLDPKMTKKHRGLPFETTPRNPLGLAHKSSALICTLV